MKLYNHRLEVRVLRTLCGAEDDKERAKFLSKLSPDYFYDEVINKTFLRFLELLKAHGHTPTWEELVTDPHLSEEVRSELKDSSKVKPIIKTNRLNMMYKQLNTFRQARILAVESENILKSLDQDEVNIEKLLDRVSDSVSTARVDGIGKTEITTIGHKSNSSKLFKELLSNKRPAVLRTGFVNFDHINGGFLPGSLVVIAATTGGGKSAMGVQLGINIAKYGNRVCLIPLEMSRKEVLARIVSNTSEVDVSKYLYTKLTVKEKARTVKRWESLEKDLSSVRGVFRIFEPEADLSIEEILTILKPYNDDIILVDYIGLLRGVDGDDSWRQLGNAARTAKTWARTNNCVVVLMAQLSSEGAIKYSRTIQEHADNMWSWIYSEESKETNLIEVSQPKARNQQAFTFRLEHDFKTMRIFDAKDVNDYLEDEDTVAGKKKKGKNVKKGKKDKMLDKYLKDASN